MGIIEQFLAIRSSVSVPIEFKMRFFILLTSLFFVVLSVRTDEELPELALAEPCDEEACQLPTCRCSSIDIPGGLAPRDTPQFVMLTFDDGVNMLNMNTYRNIMFNRSNRNGCAVGGTFFINHEYTNYQLVNELYNNGFEPALHSISHQIPQGYWAEATYEDMRSEFGEQKIQMSHFANIPLGEIKGMRIPFLQMNGNNSFLAMANYDIQYDCTWATVNYVEPGLWPYTLDYASTQDCQVPPCPNASIPGPWVLPMVSWFDLEGTACAMVDSCYSVPPLDDEEAWFEFIVANFERSYLGNRAPFGFFIHEWYLAVNSAVERALIRFLDMINNMEDVFMVNGGEVIEWVQNPVPVDEYKTRACRSFERTPCIANTCGPLTSEHSDMSYWMSICGDCPRSYPWVGNPLGIVNNSSETFY